MSESRTIPLTKTAPGACCDSGCCGDSTTAAIEAGTDVRAIVRERYDAVVKRADGEATSCGCACCGDVDPEHVLEQIGYSAEDAASIPDGANLGLGCGNPTALASLRPGETVLDLGSGAGIDCFLAAKAVGPEGRVLGVDMTPSMLERARTNAAKVGASNVEFRLGEIEHLPVADASIDAVISNCVVNLSPDKPAVFREVHRVLKPGGRMLLSDLVLTRALAPELQRDVALYVGCIGGAAVREDYLRMIAEAGFDDVAVVAEHAYDIGSESLAAADPLREAYSVVRSVQVRATRH